MNEDQFMELWDKFVPDRGSAETYRGEILRHLGKIHYELFNNGGGNNMTPSCDFLIEHRADVARTRQERETLLRICEFLRLCYEESYFFSSPQYVTQYDIYCEAIEHLIHGVINRWDTLSDSL
jgi:hypothetical protein